jgi:hypothetical protein
MMAGCLENRARARRANQFVFFDPSESPRSPSKIFHFRRRANHWHLFARLAPERGADRDRHETLARDAMDAADVRHFVPDET